MGLFLSLYLNVELGGRGAAELSLHRIRIFTYLKRGGFVGGIVRVLTPAQRNSQEQHGQAQESGQPGAEEAACIWVRADSAYARTMRAIHH